MPSGTPKKRLNYNNSISKTNCHHFKNGVIFFGIALVGVEKPLPLLNWQPFRHIGKHELCFGLRRAVNRNVNLPIIGYQAGAADGQPANVLLLNRAADVPQTGFIGSEMPFKIVAQYYIELVEQVD